jgi:glutaminyl-peptide cyclotransferase
MFTAAFALTGCSPGASEPVSRPGSTTPAVSFTAVHASNALARVSALLALGPREAGTPGAERAAQWLAAQLRGAGLANARVGSFEDHTPVGAVRFHNVLAEWPGTSPEWIVLLSHFDTKTGIGSDKEPFLGANDGGSSTGLLLELAAAMVKAGPQRRGVIFAFLDGEECRIGYSERDGLHGSRHLARELKAQARPVRAVILMDMIGDRDLHVTIPHNGTPALQSLALAAARTQGVRDSFSLLDGSILDDHQPFLDAGFPALDLIDFSYGRQPGANDYWHTPADTIDKLSADSLLTVGRVVLEMMRQLQ